MSNDSRREFRFLTGRPWLDFVATLADRFGEDPFERMWDEDRLAEWLHRAMGADRDIEVTGADLEYGRWARETMRVMADAVLDGVEPPKEAVQAANRALEPYVPPRAEIENGKLRHRAPGSVRTAVSWLMLEALLMLSSEEVEVLQRCAAPDCRAIFLDPTGRRRWCPSGRCGVKLRVRAYRERARNQDNDTDTEDH